jgi:hypothetical protein
MAGVAHRLYRLGPARLEHDSMVARRWWDQSEPALTVFVRWEGTLNVEIVR